MAHDPDDHTPRVVDKPHNRDPLPGALTQAQFENRIATGVVAAVEHGEGLALLLIDLDHFRAFEVQYGRAAADAVLVTIHECIADALAATDDLVRFGYDDFAVLCTKPMNNYGPSLAQRLRARVSGSAVEIPGAGDAYFFTASIGVSSFPTSGAATQPISSPPQRAR